MSIRDMSTAPKDGSWILGYAPSHQEFNPHSPWVVVTIGDEGWRDVDGYPIDLEGWFPLPDPQPKCTDWARAQGHVEINAGNLTGQAVWIVSIIKPDGTQDVPRDAYIYASHDGALNKAQWWSGHLGLPWKDQSNVVPFAQGQLQ